MQDYNKKFKEEDEKEEDEEQEDGVDEAQKKYTKIKQVIKNNKEVKITPQSKIEFETIIDKTNKENIIKLKEEVKYDKSRLSESKGFKFLLFRRNKSMFKKKNIRPLVKKQTLKKKISFNEALELFLKNCLNIDKEILIYALLTIFDLPVNYSSVLKKNKNPFYENDLWTYLENILNFRFRLSKSEFDKIRENIIEIFKDKSDIDLLTLNVTSSGKYSISPSQELYERRREYIKIIYDKFHELIDKHIRNMIDNFERNSKELKIIYTFLEFFKEERFKSHNFRKYEWNKNPRNFKILLKLQFNLKVSIQEFINTLIETGIYHEYNGIIHEYGFITNDFLESILTDLSNDLSEEIKLITPTQDVIIKSLSNDPFTFAALEFILSNSSDDRLKKRFQENLMEYLNKTDKKWWIKFFEKYKDRANPIFFFIDKYVVLNPHIQFEKLNKIVSEWKKEKLIPYKEEILSILKQSLDIIHYELEFDDKKGLIIGEIITSNNEKIKIIISLWYTEYLSLFDERCVIFLVGFKDKPIIDIYSELNFLVDVDVLLINIQDKYLEMISNLKNSVISSQIEDIFVRNNYKVADLTPIIEESTLEERQIDELGGLGEGKYKSIELFEKIIKSQGIKFPSELLEDTLYLIFLPLYEDEDFNASLQIICREIFNKFTKKGYPTPKIYNNIEELYKKLEGENKIEFYKDESANVGIIGIKEIKNNINLEKELSDRIRESHSRGFGFIILQMKKEKIKKFVEEIKKISQRPEIIILEPQLIQNLEKINNKVKIVKKFDSLAIDIKDPIQIKKKIASVFWGFIEPIEDPVWSNGKTFDDFFCACERKYKRKIKELFETTSIKRNDKNIIISKDPKFRTDKSAGSSHKGLKVLTIKHLIKNENVDWDDIDIEKEFEDIQPDVCIKNEIPYEIETFYGREKSPNERIDELIGKYQRNKKFSRLFIIISNLDVILWYNKFIKTKKYKEKIENFEVEFLTPDLKNKKLIKIEELKNRLNNYIKDFIKNI